MTKVWVDKLTCYNRREVMRADIQIDTLVLYHIAFKSPGINEGCQKVKSEESLYNQMNDDSRGCNLGD